MTPAPAVGLPHLKLEEIFDARIQTLTTPHRYYRVAAHRFLANLQTDFPEVLKLSELRGDPHLIGWLLHLSEQDPPLSLGRCHTYLLMCRRLLYELATAGNPLQPGLILPEDFPLRLRFPEELRSTKDRRSRLSPLLFGEIFDVRIQTLATTVGASTTRHYRGVARHFLSYLQTEFPQVLDL